MHPILIVTVVTLNGLLILGILFALRRLMRQARKITELQVKTKGLIRRTEAREEDYPEREGTEEHRTDDA